MATRTGKNWAYQEDVTAANMNKAPQGAVGRVQSTSTQSSISTTEVALTGYSLTVSTQGGPRQHRIEATVHLKPAAGLIVPTPNTAGGDIAGNQQMTVRIRKGNITGDIIGRVQIPTPSDDVASTAYCLGINTSASGSETYIATVEGYGLTTWETTNDSNRPGWFTVTDEGPAF